MSETNVPKSTSQKAIASGKAPIREIQRVEVDLSTLQRQLLGIENSSELSSQNKIAQSLELLTQLTNSSASAYFYADDNGTLAVGPRVLSKQASSWDEDILLTLHQAAKQALESGKLYISRLENKPDVSIIAAPGFDPGDRHCAITQLLRLGSEPIESFIVILQLFVSLIVKQQSESSSHTVPDFNYLKCVVNCASVASAQQSLVDNIVTNHPDVLSWTGYMHSNSVKFGAISNSAQMNKRGFYASKLIQAMLECQKVDQEIYFDSNNLNNKSTVKVSPIINDALKTISKKQICLLPIKDSDNKTNFIIGLASDDPKNLKLAAAELKAESSLLADVILQKPRGVLGRYREFKASLLDKNNKWVKPALIGIPVCLLALMLLPVTYKIDAPLIIEPVERRFISAPFSSVLKKVYVKPGDVIEKGDLLAELDERELKWKYSQLQAEFERANKQKDIEMAVGDTAKMQLSKYEASQYKAKIELVQFQLENLKLVSPISGQLVSGDVEKREGSAISIGDNLFEIAPLNKVLVELEVPAEDISYVKNDMPVKMRINALPSHKWSAEIESIQLRSSVRQDQNVFIAELKLENDTKLMRPGMNGKAKIYTVKKSLGWVLFHRVWDKLIEFSLW